MIPENAVPWNGDRFQSTERGYFVWHARNEKCPVWKGIMDHESLEDRLQIFDESRLPDYWAMNQHYVALYGGDGKLLRFWTSLWGNA